MSSTNLMIFNIFSRMFLSFIQKCSELNEKCASSLLFPGEFAIRRDLFKAVIGERFFPSRYGAVIISNYRLLSIYSAHTIIVIVKKYENCCIWNMRKSLGKISKHGNCLIWIANGFLSAANRLVHGYQSFIPFFINTFYASERFHHANNKFWMILFHCIQ